jgi:hypothetical protein
MTYRSATCRIIVIMLNRPPKTAPWRSRTAIARPQKKRPSLPPRLCVYEGGHRSKFFRKQPEELR